MFCVESLIEGEYIKHNSNSGFVEDESLRNTPQVSRPHAQWHIFWKYFFPLCYGSNSAALRLHLCSALQAFSHWTFQYTKGEKLVVDIQVCIPILWGGVTGRACVQRD
jgi:hypothetical protein